MYAVIESGGKQYRVSVGDRLKVESLRAEPGATVQLDRVLLVADGADVTVGNPLVTTPVEATVIGHGRADKVRIFKLRRRKNSRLRQGHRQHYTELRITRIGDVEAKADAPRTAAKPVAGGDDLTKINGVGPVIVEKLNAIGITTFEQIANFTAADIDRVNEELNFKGRIERDNWVEQAKQLIQGESK